MLRPGDIAPFFELPDDDGRIRVLGDFLKHGPLVLYFYPADFTPGCTAEACAFRDDYEAIVGAGLQVVGVSPQGPSIHDNFRKRLGLPFTLLADEDKSTIRDYDVDGPLGIGVRRVTYLIGMDGRIVDCVKADFRIGRHREFVNGGDRRTSGPRRRHRLKVARV